MKQKLWKNRRSLRLNLQRVLPRLTSEYFTAGREALQAGKSWDEMHRFRLLSKRFRYTLEIFRPAYGPGLEQRIEALKKVQTLLGDINDCVVTGALLEGVPGSEELRARLAGKAAAKTEKMRLFWADEFDAAGQEAIFWRRYLIGYVCRKRPERTKPAGDPVVY